MIDAELLQGFKEESTGILNELKAVIEKLEDVTTEFPVALMQDFSQKIDRIMGAAKTIAMEDPSHLGLQRISALAELCKHIGYKAAEQKELKLVPIFTAFWSDVITITEDLIGALSDATKTAEVTSNFTPVLLRRLEWLKKKVVLPNAQSGNTQQEIDRLIASLSAGAGE